MPSMSATLRETTDIPVSACPSELCAGELPRVHHMNTGIGEVFRVAGGAARLMRSAHGGNLGIRGADRTPHSLSTRNDGCVVLRRFLAKGDERSGSQERRTRSKQSCLELTSTLPFRQELDPSEQLSPRHRGQGKLLGLRFKPPQDASIGVAAEQFRDDIRVEHNHSNVAQRAGSLRAGIAMSSTPPTLKAACRKAAAILAGSVARVRISRASASIDRPCSRACSTRRCFTCSSRPRTMIDANTTTS